jgi:hypothetical protein
MKSTHFGFSWLLCAFMLMCFIAVCHIRPAKAQTVEQVEAVVKGHAVDLGPMQCRGPLITCDKKQVLSDADFKTLLVAAKVDSGTVCSNYKVVPMSAAMGKKPDNGIIDKIVEFIFGG